MKPSLLALFLIGMFVLPLHAETAASDHSSFESKRESYQKKIEKDLSRLSGKIDDLRHRSEKAGADTRVKADRQLDGLQKDLDAARKKAAGLTEQTEDGWEKFRRGLDETLTDLKKSYRKTASKF